MGRLISACAFASMSIIGGTCLATVIASFFFETPLLLKQSLYLMLCVAHGQQLPGLGGMETLGLACLLASSVVSVAIILWLGAAAMRSGQAGRDALAEWEDEYAGARATRPPVRWMSSPHAHR
jgi:hypothetical protein